MAGKAIAVVAGAFVLLAVGSVLMGADQPRKGANTASLGQQQGNGVGLKLQMAQAGGTWCGPVGEGASYRSSTLEQAWLDNVDTWQTDYCSAQALFADKVTKLEGKVANIHSSEVPLQTFAKEDPGLSLLSRMSPKVHCVNSAGVHTAAPAAPSEPIEPLYGLLRSPQAWKCPEDKGNTLMDTKYLLLSHSSYANVKAAPRKFYFDVGASVWEGLSQQWMLNAYAEQGIEFDRILMWEMKPVNVSDTLGKVPSKWYHAYQFFNEPASGDHSDLRNPLNIIKRITRPEDFVVIKLDIDHFGIENSYVEAIMTDPELTARVDEFFWEQHFQFRGLIDCCWHSQAEKDKTLADAYAPLHRMRQLGIRAHGWP